MLAVPFARLCRKLFQAVDGSEPAPHEQQRAQDAYRRMRTIIGALAFFLPIILVVGGLVVGVCVQPSISAYYHTAMGDWFVGMLFAVAFFLFGYGAYSAVDDFAATLGGFAALGVALCAVNTVPALHLLSAAVLFLTLAFFCFCLFTRGDPKSDGGKKNRNRVYRASGWVIVVSIAIIAAMHVFGKATAKCCGQDCLARWRPVLVFEWCALWAFGVSWAVKGTVQWRFFGLSGNHRRAVKNGETGTTSQKS